MIQYVQEYTNAAVLDCLFQHIPLELCMGTNSRKKEVEIPAEVSEAGSAAVHAITSGSVLFCVESLCPIAPKKMASLAGAVFGLMLHNLPAYVRGWFNEIRDRLVSSAIESFTKAWCSPTLISNELSEVYSNFLLFICFIGSLIHSFHCITGFCIDRPNPNQKNKNNNNIETPPPPPQMPVLNMAYT